jgi:hypothetical protein
MSLRCVSVRAQLPSNAPSSRRAVLRGAAGAAGAALLAIGTAGRVSAKDYKEALAE